MRTDTVDEAKMKLYREILMKVWLLPRNCINMQIGVENSSPEFFNGDDKRRHLDSEKSEATDPIRQWGKPVGNG